LGLRQNHYLLDIGCGSLRAGRLLMTYLLPGHYFGIEPTEWPIEAVLEEELGAGFLQIRKPVISHNDCFNLSLFGQRFDYILAHSIFTHAALPQIEKCLSEVKKTLGLTGIFAATYAEGDADFEGSEWQYPHCIEYRADTLRQLAQKAGLLTMKMPWPLFNPTGQHKLLLMVHPENAEGLALTIAARARGEITMTRGQ